MKINSIRMAKELIITYLGSKVFVLIYTMKHLILFLGMVGK